jgi:hypothetical protein
MMFDPGLHIGAPRRLVVAVVALAALLVVAWPATASAAPSIVKLERQLKVTKKHRIAACRRHASRRCRRLKRSERRLKARIASHRMAPSPVRTLYVAPSGHDAGAGSRANPLATLSEALGRATGGQKIRLAAGSYAEATDVTARSTTVHVIGPGAGKAFVAGLIVRGGQELDVSGLTFSARITVRYSTTRGLAQPARNIAFHHDEFTAPGSTWCVEARNGVKGFTVTDSYIHDCGAGFVAAAGGAIPRSTGLTLARNRMEHFSADGIQFGQWDNVSITDNAISDIVDPARVQHNDGIQLMGNDVHVVIARNRISGSNGQLIFIQDAVGPIDDVLVQDNLVYRAPAVAIQSQGATRARFVHNTVWDAKDGGLWLTQGYRHPGTQTVVPKDTVVADNVLSTYRKLGGAATAVSAGNVIACAGGQMPTNNVAAGWACLRDVGFVDAAARDYRLRADSKARFDGVARRGVAPGALR